LPELQKLVPRSRFLRKINEFLGITRQVEKLKLVSRVEVVDNSGRPRIVLGRFVPRIPVRPAPSLRCRSE
jgi:hypothetical protein